MPEGKAAFNVALAAATVAGPVLGGVAVATVGAPPWSRLRESIRYVARNEALRMLLVGEGVAFAFFYLVVPVTVVYASDSLHAGSGGYAAILAAWGAGIAIGSAAHVRLGRRIGPGLIFVSTSAGPRLPRHGRRPHPGRRLCGQRHRRDRQRDAVGLRGDGRPGRHRHHAP